MATPSRTSFETCPPRWATRRNPNRETLGPEAARIAQTLGQPLLWWQQLVFNVQLELDPDTGLLFYRENGDSVPRQNGKTFKVLVKKLHRATLYAARVGRPQRMAYTAQTGNDARKKMLDDELPLIQSSPLRSAVEDVRKVNGSEAIIFKGGSRVDVLASSASSGHGKTLDEGYVDEAFDDVDDRREQAMLPAMSTRQDAQLNWCSTMGTDASVYLNRKVDVGRASTLLEVSDMSYFEWSAPLDADPDDPATWYSCMPALGWTISERAVRHARQTMTDGEFRRAYLNQRTQSEERVIPRAAWEAVCLLDVQPDGRVFFAVDVNPDRTGGSIAVADMAGNVELVEHESGTGWIAPRAEQLARKWGSSIIIDASGPATPFVEELQGRGVQVQPVVGRDLAKACGTFYDAIADQKVRIRRSELFPRLDAACAAATKRISGDTWTWSRKDATTDISPLVAVTLAYWAAQQGVDPVSQVF